MTSSLAAFRTIRTTLISFSLACCATWLPLDAAAGGNGKGNGQGNKTPPPPPAPVITSYSGYANALYVDDVQEPIPGPIVIANTGNLPSAGGTLEANEVDYKLMAADGVTVALSVELAHARISGGSALTTGETTLSNFHVLIQNTAGQIFAIDADYIGASANASIGSDGNGAVDSSVSIDNLRIDGVPVNVTGAANQTVPVPGGHLVINEQTKVVASGQAQITVTPFHFYIDGCMNGSVGTINAGITGSAAPVDEHDCGKLTGGGWIVGPSGQKATFGISGGIRRGEFWGHLNYIDHGAGLKVQSTAVTNYQPNPRVPDCRIISYDVTINGLPGTAVVDAWDRGEPGRNDFFSIKLSTGYSARGTLGGDGPGGGNLQLHKCPPGWDK